MKVKVERAVKHTASRHACSCLASELVKEEIKFDPESPLAKAMTASLVLVSPSTCSKSYRNQLHDLYQSHVDE